MVSPFQGEFNWLIKPMGKIPQVNDKIDRASGRATCKWRSDREAVAAKASAELA
tara:strand:- start:186 stop:347 length:162 start_codon:yes stop_codon:yes gene_type:complete